MLQIPGLHTSGQVPFSCRGQTSVIKSYNLINMLQTYTKEMSKEGRYRQRPHMHSHLISSLKHLHFILIQQIQPTIMSPSHILTLPPCQPR